jgi:hypothetical protein
VNNSRDCRCGVSPAISVQTHIFRFDISPPRYRAKRMRIKHRVMNADAVAGGT